jgi:short-subunit dehydrogenase
MPYAIITGATQGIGKAIAEKLLSEGFSIAVCARNKEDLQLLEKQWSSQYPNAIIIAHPTDLSRKEDVTDFAAIALEKFPQIDVLVNNAGTFIPGALADEPEGHLEMLMSVNLYSAYHLTRQLLPVMKEKKAGHIFNMCSVASLQAYPNGGSYGISKYALLGFSENLRAELMLFNIKVTALCPGATYSRSWEGSGVPADRMINSRDIASTLWAAYNLSAQANVETIVIRPLKGDL